MTEKQKYLLKLFREVDEICREHNLRYVLAGGSLIGALRHEGFVPWDDDVDLYATFGLGEIHRDMQNRTPA